MKAIPRTALMIRILLKYYNGIASWSKIIGRYCGSVIPPAITSDSNKLRIEFHSNTQYAGRGFDAMYSLKAIGEQGIYVCYYYY